MLSLFQSRRVSMFRTEDVLKKRFTDYDKSPINSQNIIIILQYETATRHKTKFLLPAPIVD